MSIAHELIVPSALEARQYQCAIADVASRQSTLVVLPTGMGKTVVALLVIADCLKVPGTKILFLAPTKPLVTQHARFLQTYLTTPDVVTCFTGEVSPEQRVKQWADHRIIVSTPQVIENDLIAKRIDLSTTSLVVFDEVHRTVGNYSYVFIASMYKKQRQGGLSLGMTASPGNDLTKILEVCAHLEVRAIEIRTSTDPDVRPYIHDLSIQWKEVTLPREFAAVLQLLRRALSERLKALHTLGVVESHSLSTINRKKLLEIQARIQEHLRSTPTPPQQLFTAASTQNAALKVYHAIELLQTQGMASLRNYFSRLAEEASSKGGSKASRDLCRDPLFLEAVALSKTISVDHPKIPEIVSIVRNQLAKNPASKIIVFTHYRDTSQLVATHLATVPGARPVRFIGQAGKGADKGLSQKEQIAILRQFEGNDYNVLIATSVAEEGLDIPSTDLVVFYEPVPSEIRTIQRRGRTARKMAGSVVILIAKDTPDEAYYWASKYKEQRMRSELEVLRASLRKHLGSLPKASAAQAVAEQQTLLQPYPAKKAVHLIVDHRESRSPVIRFLAEHDADVAVQELAVGDYVLSQRVGVERKTVDDFLGTLVEGRLFGQVKALRQAYSRPLLVIEGEGLLTTRNISHAAIFGSLGSIIVDFGVSVMPTNSPKETADFLYAVAAREQREATKAVAVRGEKWAPSATDQQRFVVEGLPNVSAVLAQRLLQHFGSIRAIANATEEELCEVHGIGPSTAATIVALLTRDYLPS